VRAEPGPLEPPLPDVGLLQAPAHWRAVDLLSDLHLHHGDADTLALLSSYLASECSGEADALIVLGDLFEVWIGDDLIDCAPEATGLTPDDSDALRFWHEAVRQLAEHACKKPIWFMAGNRDFLLGSRGLQACGMQCLQDPTRLEMGEQRWLLSHGDALCLADTDYQAFRRQVRQPAWQAAVLGRPLPERLALARHMRAQSREHQQHLGDPTAWADVDEPEALRWLRHADCSTLIHGHTHRPGEHTLAPGYSRVVLSDWEGQGIRPRAEILRLDARGWRRLPLVATA
jgi:UDP-2,3-diacylglucosamine hydrolase